MCDWTRGGAARAVMVAVLGSTIVAMGAAQGQAVAAGALAGPVTRANWPQANRFTSEALRPFLYSSSVTARFINDTDAFWYSWRDRSGITFYHVDPKTRTKKPLFDTDEMAGKLSEATKKPFDATNLPITTLTFSKDAKTISFTAEHTRLEYHLDDKQLKNPGRSPPPA